MCMMFKAYLKDLLKLTKNCLTLKQQDQVINFTEKYCNHSSNYFVLFVCFALNEINNSA